MKIGLDGEASSNTLKIMLFNTKVWPIQGYDELWDGRAYGGRGCQLLPWCCRCEAEHFIKGRYMGAVE